MSLPLLIDDNITAKFSKNLRDKYAGYNNTSNNAIKIIKPILERFQKNHTINFLNHIKTIIKVERTIDAGFEFIPQNGEILKSVLLSTNKFKSDKDMGVPGKLAMKATHGEGIREVVISMNEKSLHCAIAGDKCSIHLDKTAFSSFGPNGGIYFSIDCIQHIGKDLIYMSYMVPWIVNNMPFGRYLKYPLDRISPIFPNTTNELSRYGFKFEIYDLYKFKIGFEYKRDFNGMNILNASNIRIKNGLSDFLSDVKDYGKGFDGGNPHLGLFVGRRF